MTRLFRCEVCNCIEDTRLCRYWLLRYSIRNPRPKIVCSLCDPQIGEWHGKFDRVEVTDLLQTDVDGFLVLDHHDPNPGAWESIVHWILLNLPTPT